MSDAAETSDATAAFASLRGLALGDGFGERWFFRKKREAIDMIRHRTTPGDQPWHSIVGSPWRARREVSFPRMRGVRLVG